MDRQIDTVLICAHSKEWNIHTNPEHIATTVVVPQSQLGPQGMQQILHQTQMIKARKQWQILEVKSSYRGVCSLFMCRRQHRRRPSWFVLINNSKNVDPIWIVVHYGSALWQEEFVRDMLLPARITAKQHRVQQAASLDQPNVALCSVSCGK